MGADSLLRVDDQIEEELLKMIRVTVYPVVHRLRAGHAGRVENDLVKLQVMTCQRGHSLKDIHQRHRTRFGAAVLACKRQEARDDLAGTTRLCDDQFEIFTRSSDWSGERAVSFVVVFPGITGRQNDLGAGDDGGQRIAELVRDTAHHLTQQTQLLELDVSALARVSLRRFRREW